MAWIVVLFGMLALILTRKMFPLKRMKQKKITLFASITALNDNNFNPRGLSHFYDLLQRHYRARFTFVPINFCIA